MQQHRGETSGWPVLEGGPSGWGRGYSSSSDGGGRVAIMGKKCIGGMGLGEAGGWGGSALRCRLGDGEER